MQWLHVTLTSYGAWLPGDPRGFRTRHHRQHVDGDYKNPPPPGVYEKLLRRSRSLLKADPVIFPKELRPRICDLIREKLQRLEQQVIAIAVAGQHVHLLIKCVPSEIHRHIEFTKRHVTFSLKEQNWTGPVWAGGKHIRWIRDREHQLNVFHYILRHADQGAAVWKYSDQT